MRITRAKRQMHDTRDRERVQSGRMRPTRPPAAPVATAAAQSQRHVARASAIDHARRFGGSGAARLRSRLETTPVTACESARGSPTASNSSIESCTTARHLRPFLSLLAASAALQAARSSRRQARWVSRALNARRERKPQSPLFGLFARRMSRCAPPGRGPRPHADDRNDGDPAHIEKPR